MAGKREIKESPLMQGIGERIAYTLTTTPWGSTPTSPVVKLKTCPDLIDVSSTKLNGSASANGDVITTPLIIDLQDGKEYRLEITFVCSGNTFMAWAKVLGEA